MKQIISILFIIFYLFPYKSADSQNKLDSLISEFKTAKTLSDKYVLLHKLDTVIDLSVPKDSVQMIWQSLIDHCIKTNYPLGSNFCKYNLAKEYRNNGNYFESLALLNEALNYYQEADSARLAAQIYNSLGIFYKNIRRLDIAQEQYLRSIDISKELNDSVQIAWVYLNLGALAQMEKDYDSAIGYLRNSEKILKIKDLKNLVNCYINFGDLYTEIENTDSAYYYLSKAYSLAKKIETVEEKFQSSFYLGRFLFDRNRFDEAEPFLLEAEKLNKNHIVGGFPIGAQALFYDVLSRYYERQKNFETAYRYSSISKNLDAQNKSEQFQNDFNIRNFNESFKEEEIKRKRSVTTNIITLVVLTFALLILYLLYRSYKHKKEANRLLTEMDELKNRLYSNITHELRTPLTLILGPIEQMLSDETKKTPTRKQVKMMRKNANSLLGLVNQMLDLSKIDAKNMKLELVEEDINKFIRTRFAAFASLADQKSITFNCSRLNEKNIQIFDASKLEKIINNLVSNAVKFTHKNGKINCYANFPNPDILKLTIEDDGKGISKEELGRIFDRFYQANNGAQNIGTGIGLALTKELVELMHGKVEVQSETGKGTTFNVTIPLGTNHLMSDEYQMIQNLNAPTNQEPELPDENDTVEETECHEISNKTSNKLPHVLVVEDNTDIRNYISENLNDCFSVEQSKNGKAGLKYAINNVPDLVITDIVMPKMDGIELCDKLKNDEKTSHIPVIILTGKSGTKDRLEGIKTGADAYLTKPFNIKELRLLAISLIEQRQKLRERFTRDLRLEPKDIAVTSVDEKFISRAMEIIEKNIGNSEFEVKQFQEEMFMSRMQLFRKIKALTNQTPGDFIRTIRLKRAASLIKQNFGNIAQITFEVGFNNPSYFAKCFKDLFGELPSDYMKSHHHTEA